MMDLLIQSNSATETTRASSLETRYQYRSPFSGAPGSSRFPKVVPQTTAGYSPAMVTRATQISHRRPPTPQHSDTYTDDETASPNRNGTAQYSEISDVREQYENIIDAITTLPNRLQTTSTNHRLLHTQVSTFRRRKDPFNAFDHLLLSYLTSFSNRLTKELKFQHFQCALREEATYFFSLTNIIHGDDLFRGHNENINRQRVQMQVNHMYINILSLSFHFCY